MSEREELLALADQIACSTGLLRMVPGDGPTQLGIKRTAMVIAALRASAAAAPSTPQVCDEGDHAAGSNGDKCFACFCYNREQEAAPEPAAGPLREALEAAIRCAKLALFVIRKQGIMPNSSWESGFNADLKKAEDGLVSVSHPDRSPVENKG